MLALGNVELIFYSLARNNAAACLSGGTAPAPTLKSHSEKTKKKLKVLAE